MDRHERRLLAYLADELDATATEEFTAHLSECARCQRALQQDLAGGSVVEQLRETPPPWLDDRLRMRIALEAGTTGTEPTAAMGPDSCPRTAPHRRRRVALATAVASATAVLLFGLPGHAPDSDTISTVARQARALPATVPQSGARPMGPPETVRATDGRVTLRPYRSGTTPVMVATTDGDIQRPPDAATMPGPGQPWAVQRGALSLYCPSPGTVIAAERPVRRLPQLAQALDLD